MHEQGAEEENTNTGATRAVSTTQQGDYNAAALTPGDYSIMVEANGFKTVHQNGVIVEAGYRARLDCVLGGPIIKDKLFFFGSYEGLQVRQPEIADTYVPSLASRQSAPAAVQPLLNAFPLPNGPNLGNGTAGFTAGHSNPSSLDSYGLRVDYLLGHSATIFGR